MIPARVFYGSPVVSIQRLMDQHLSQDCPALTLHSEQSHTMEAWYGIRMMYLWFQSRLGTDHWLALTEQHQNLLHFIHFPVPQAYADSHPIALDIKSQCNHAAFSRHLNHAWGVRDSLYQQAAELLVQLMACHPVAVMVPDLSRLDHHSREVLLRMAKLCNSKHGELLVGIAQIQSSEARRWFRQQRSGSVLEKDALFHWLSSLDLALDCADIDASKWSPAINDQQQQIIKEREHKRRQWQLKAEKALERIRPNQLPAILQSICAWYACFAFEQALAEAQFLNKYHRQELNAEAQGLLDSIIMLCACHQEEQEKDLHLWIDLVADHGASALESLPHSVLRCNVLLCLTRLSFQYPDDLESTQDYVVLTERCAHTLLSPHREYFLLWAALYQMRSYYQKPCDIKPIGEERLAQLSEQVFGREYDKAFDRSGSTQQLAQRDQRLTAAVLKTTLCQMNVHGVGFSVGCPSTVLHPQYDGDYAISYEADYWLGFHAERLDVSAALVWAEALQASSESLALAESNARGSYQRASLCYQLGALTQANREYADWRARQDKWRSRLSHPAGDEHFDGSWLNMMMAAWRQGSIHTAQAILDYQLSLNHRDRYDEKAYCFAVSGLLNTSRGDKDAAKEDFNKAIKQADQTYSLSVYATITRIIGLAYESSGQTKKALALYQNLLKNSLHLPHVRAADIFSCMVRAMVLDSYHRDYVHYILSNLDRILEKAENWWYLGGVLELIRQNESANNLALFDLTQLSTLVWSVSQRVDCEAVSRQFVQKLGGAQQTALYEQLQQRCEQLEEYLPREQLASHGARMLQRHLSMWMVPLAGVPQRRIVRH